MIKNTLIILFFTVISKIATACDSEEYRQFDFWLGEWQVTNLTNDQVSKSKITSINNGCGILEEYQTPTGYEGKSLNIFNEQTQKWHQTWIDNTGLLLQLDGEFSEGKMVLVGDSLTKNGKTVTNKFSWQKLEDGRVNQVWQTSNDGGKTWQVAFDGYYKKP